MAVSPAANSTVISGKARFQVLSPTVIRTEYSEDARFQDGATFNVVGRDNFDKPSFTSNTVDGWLTIQTSDVTLKYQVGSGPFRAANLTAQLKWAGQAVTATPWARSQCPVGVRCEAENNSAVGLKTTDDHTGYTGEGFVAGFEHVGDTLAVELFGPNVLVAPITTAGNVACTPVWFPPGQWTDYFTGKTYAGTGTQNVSADLNAMPVFIKAGNFIVTRDDNVANDVQNPLTHRRQRWAYRDHRPGARRLQRAGNAAFMEGGFSQRKQACCGDRQRRHPVRQRLVV